MRASGRGKAAAVAMALVFFADSARGFADPGVDGARGIGRSTHGSGTGGTLATRTGPMLRDAESMGRAESTDSNPDPGADTRIQPPGWALVVTPLAGWLSNTSTFTVKVSDGVFNMVMQDTGGKDGNAVINNLELQRIRADLIVVDGSAGAEDESRAVFGFPIIIERGAPASGLPAVPTQIDKVDSGALDLFPVLAEPNDPIRGISSPLVDDDFDSLLDALAGDVARSVNATAGDGCTLDVGK